MRSEIQRKWKAIREILSENNLSGVRLRGVDWFAWASGGGSSMVLMSSEIGVAEILITADDAFVLTDIIEERRLREEEAPSEYNFWAGSWQAPLQREAFVREFTNGGRIASDRPIGHEFPLPQKLQLLKRKLGPEELERYRQLGRDASEAMTEALKEARPEWTGYQLAARGAQALWSRGIHPTLTLVGESRRLPLHRHATASSEKLGETAMLVFCARRHGLYANLTRFVSFRPLTSAERKRNEALARIEAAAFAATRPGKTLGEVYQSIAAAYAEQGYADEINLHHQGGPTGYLAREEIALPGSSSPVMSSMAFAWNPSLTGTKIEDTIYLHDDGRIEVLTTDSAWPTFLSGGMARPDYWESP